MKNNFRDILLLVHVVSATVSILFPIVVAIGSVKFYFELKQNRLTRGSFEFFRLRPAFIGRINYLVPLSGLTVVMLSHYSIGTLWLVVGVCCWIVNLVLLEAGIFMSWKDLSGKLPNLLESYGNDEDHTASFERLVKEQNLGSTVGDIWILPDNTTAINYISKKIKTIFAASAIDFIVLFMALYMMVRQP